MQLKRIWHPIDTWEEINSSMWFDSNAVSIESVISFTGDHILYGAAMFRVIQEWPVSCENSLTNYRINRKAWLGHAAAALEIGSPEKITRKAWGFLSDSQRALANREAARYISIWEVAQAKSGKLHQNLGEPMLF